MHKILVVSLTIVLVLLAVPQGRAQCPTIPDNSALANDHKPFGWPPGTTINVYVDTSKLSAAGVAGVTAAVNNWSSTLTAYSITINITNVNGIPASPSGSYLVISTGSVGAGFDALTSSSFNTSTRGVNNSQTMFDPTWAASATQTQFTDLMAHEFSHTFWEGDCTSTTCSGTSVSYQNGNSLDAPSQCDKTAIQTIKNANYNPGGTGGTGGGQGGGEAQCPGPPPNDTCSCNSVTGSYDCECSGVAPTCSDGTQAVCFDAGWTCGTVTTSSCVGSPPICPDGSDATCDTDQWTCPPNDCIDVCDPSCSDYDPTDPSCGGGCDPTVDPTCGGDCFDPCDPACVNFDPSDPSCGGGGGGGGCETDCCMSVTPCDIACDMVPLQQRKFWIGTPSASLAPKPTKLARAQAQCASIPLGRKSVTSAFASDITKSVQKLIAPQPSKLGSSNISAVEFAALTGSTPSFGDATAPVTIVEFSDFQCPYCKRMAAILSQQVLPAEGSNIRLVYKYFPLPRHTWAQQAAEITECARLQDEHAFWQLHDFLFENQVQLKAETLEQEVLHQLGGNSAINITRLQSCIRNHETRSRVLQDVAQGTQNGVHGTPTLFINGIRINGAQSAELLRKAIAQARAEETPAHDTRIRLPAPFQTEIDPFCNLLNSKGGAPCQF